MPRKHRIYSNQYPYHITARCINREWFDIPLPEVWEIFSRHLFFTHYAFSAKIHSFVLMNNHFHLLVSTPEANIDKIMWYLMKEVSRDITQFSGRINQTFGGPYLSCLINSYHYYLHAYKYIYRNPVDAGIVGRVEEYKYSTLCGLLGKDHIFIPMAGDELLFTDLTGTLDWLNELYAEGSREEVQRALNRSEFTLSKNRVSRRPSLLETIRS